MGPQYITLFEVKINTDAILEVDDRSFRADFTNNEIDYGYQVDENRVFVEGGLAWVVDDARVKDVSIQGVAPNQITAADRALAADIVRTFCGEINRRLDQNPFDVGVFVVQPNGVPVWRYKEVCI